MFCYGLIWVRAILRYFRDEGGRGRRFYFLLEIVHPNEDLARQTIAGDPEGLEQLNIGPPTPFYFSWLALTTPGYLHDASPDPGQIANIANATPLNCHPLLPAG